MKKDGTKVDVKIKVLKPYDKKMTLILKPLETKEIKFDKIASISVTNHGIVDVKQDTKSVKITGTSKGKTIVIIYGRDNAQLKMDITVE
jgi:Flp pilus assembly secretin CpaC